MLIRGLSAFLALTLLTAAPVFADTAVVKGKTYVYIRSKATKNSAKAGVVVGGRTVQVLGYENGWTMVQYGGAKGYIRSDLLTAGAAQSSGSTAKASSSDSAIPEEIYVETKATTPAASAPAASSSAGSTAVEVTPASGTAYVNVSSYVNVRKKPSASASRAGILNKNTKVEITGKSGSWTQIRCGKVTGFIRSDLLRVDNTAKSSTAANNATANTASAADSTENAYGIVYASYSDVPVLTSGTGVVNAASLMVRSTPSKSGKALGVVKKGQSVSITGTQNGWYKISWKGGAGYISGRYISAAAAASANTSAPASSASTASAASSSAKTGTRYSASSDEVAKLAAMIQCEAGGESREGKIAVGAVILNRVASSKYPNTIEGVISQKGQFSPYRSGRYASVLSKGANAACVEAAKAALNGENPVGSCVSFRAGTGKGIQIGNQHFF